YMSLNVSPATVLTGSLAAALAHQPLDRLILEITEHASIGDYEIVANVLEPLREQGLRLAVDDAGAGFASFRHILKLKPDVIKLDGSLIRNIDSSTGCRALAAALIRFAEETGSKVVAECIETEAELAVLRELKVNKAQGFLLGRPVPITAPVSAAFEQAFS
ncbi:MAG TPA: diguanylate phosphodiesterase, partial [Pseudomonas sp.]|nr:diguanylate phosphodiesterase [Pseudomonas sp.]HBS77655.1 diguanylate phosphodiesterase [Pseudomonas sp.]